MDDEQDPKPVRKRGSGQREHSPLYKANNEGGYGNPPVKHQFKGKPGPGRPRGSTSLEAAMKKVLRGKMPLKSGGSMPYFEALALAARDSTLKKTPASTEFGLRLWDRFGKEPSHSDQNMWDTSVYNEFEFRLLEWLLSRGLGQAPEAGVVEVLFHDVLSGEITITFKKLTDGGFVLEATSSQVQA